MVRQGSLLTPATSVGLSDVPAAGIWVLVVIYDARIHLWTSLPFCVKECPHVTI